MSIVHQGWLKSKQTSHSSYPIEINRVVNCTCVRTRKKMVNCFGGNSDGFMYIGLINLSLFSLSFSFSVEGNDGMKKQGRHCISLTHLLLFLSFLFYISSIQIHNRPKPCTIDLFLFSLPSIDGEKRLFFYNKQNDICIIESIDGVVVVVVIYIF